MKKKSLIQTAYDNKTGVGDFDPEIKKQIIQEYQRTQEAEKIAAQASAQSETETQPTDEESKKQKLIDENLVNNRNALNKVIMNAGKNETLLANLAKERIPFMDFTEYPPGMVDWFERKAYRENNNPHFKPNQIKTKPEILPIDPNDVDDFWAHSRKVLKKDEPVIIPTLHVEPEIIESSNDETTAQKKRDKAKELVGAYKAFLVSQNFSRALMGKILEDFKTGKKWKYLGHKDFDEFCKLELNISRSTAFDILNERQTLGALVVENLEKIGLRGKDIKALTQGVKDEKVTTDADASATKINIDGEEIEISVANKDRIEEKINQLNEAKAKALTDFAKADEERIINKNKYDNLKKEFERPIPEEIEKFQVEMKAFEMQVFSILNQVETIREKVEKDVPKRDLVDACFAAIDELIIAKREKLFPHREFN